MVRINNFIKFCLLFMLVATVLATISSYSQDTKSQVSKKELIEITYENAQIVDHPVLGILILSKDRWKNWIVRTFIIISIFIALIILYFSMPKNSEINIIISYFLGGAMFVISFWTTLCGWMLTRLNKTFLGLIFAALSLPMYIITYIVMIKTKKSDISYATLKESFQKLSALSQEDKRLTPVSGLPGDWGEEELIH